MDVGSSFGAQMDSFKGTLVTRLKSWGLSLIFVISAGELERLQGIWSGEQSLWWHNHYQCPEGKIQLRTCFFTWCQYYARDVGLCSQVVKWSFARRVGQWRWKLRNGNDLKILVLYSHFTLFLLLSSLRKWMQSLRRTKSWLRTVTVNWRNFGKTLTRSLHKTKSWR